MEGLVFYSISSSVVVWLLLPDALLWQVRYFLVHSWMLIVSFWLWLCHSPILLSSCQCPKSFRMLDYLFTIATGYLMTGRAWMLFLEHLFYPLKVFGCSWPSCIFIMVSFSLCDTQIVRAVHPLFTTTWLSLNALSQNPKQRLSGSAIQFLIHSWCRAWSVWLLNFCICVHSHSFNKLDVKVQREQCLLKVINAHVCQFITDAAFLTLFPLLFYLSLLGLFEKIFDVLEMFFMSIQLVGGFPCAASISFSPTCQ